MTTVSGKRVRYRLERTWDNGADYAVSAQEAPRARWHQAGIVSRFGASNGAQWAALGATADAWTCYRRTRSEAVADMLAGLTFRNYA